MGHSLHGARHFLNAGQTNRPFQSHFRMKFAIIAAGEGSRLAEEGITAPKPLIPLNGVPMIERLVRIFAANDAEEIVIIVNHLRPETEKFVRHLGQTHPEWNIRLEVATTPSSMHSFARIAPLLAGAPFCLTTVDTIFREADFRNYIAAFRSALEAGLDGLMAVTDFIDDESPLYIGTDEALRIDGFYDKREPRFRFISGGIYALAPHALDTLRRCMAEGQSRMRNFQRGLIADGLKLKAHPFSKILDVDHAADIPKAEAFLRGC